MTLQETIQHCENEIFAGNYATEDHVVKLRSHVYANAVNPDRDYYELLLEIIDQAYLKTLAVIYDKKVADLTEADFKECIGFESLEDIVCTLGGLGISEKRVLNMKFGTVMKKYNPYEGMDW